MIINPNQTVPAASQGGRVTNRELVRIVEEQGRRPVGIPVLLFTDATLAASGSAEETSVVRQAAHGLGYDLQTLEMFSTESYLLQTVAGQLTVGA
jgi:hypothetical protein